METICYQPLLSIGKQAVSQLKIATHYRLSLVADAQKKDIKYGLADWKDTLRNGYNPVA